MNHYALKLAPLVHWSKWQLMLYWVSECRAGGGRGGMGGKDGEIFFPFSSQEFSINLLFKAKSRRITFLQMEKGTLPRMEELSTQETEEKSFG